MRIARLDLIRFGRFTDQSLELPARDADFHLIVGPNEAGKSTARAALGELLFGIAARSPYDFVHPYASMRIGAVLEHDGRTLTIRRRKGNKNTLLDEHDGPLSESRLAALLGGADRAFFERMFSLDHESLVEGGKQLLDAKDDLGRMLFQASGGLSRFGAVLEALESEADALWGPRKKEGRAYYAAQSAYEEAGRRLAEKTVRAKQFRDAEEALESARRAKLDVDARHAAQVREKARLERIKRVAPMLDRRRALRERLEEIGEVAPLPADAAVTLARSREAISVAHHDGERLARELAERKGALAAIAIDASLLARAGDVRRLGERRLELRRHRGDIAKRQAEVQRAWLEVARLREELGWPDGPLEELRARIPREPARRELEELIERYGVLENERANAASALESKRRERAEAAAEAEARREAARETGALGALRDALERARKLGDVEERRRELAVPLERAEANLARALRQLAPWQGDLDALGAMVVPSDEAIAEVAERFSTHAQRLDRAREERDAVRAELDQLRLREQQMRRDARPVAREELEEARAERDRRWHDVRAWATSGEGTVEELEGLAGALDAAIVRADQLADRRFEAAEASAKLQKLRDDIEAGELRLRAIEARLAGLDAEREEAQRALAALHDGMGISLPTPAKLSDWAKRRAAALALGEQRDEAARALAQHEAAVEAAEAGLRAALEATGVAPESFAGRSFSGLVATASETLDAHGAAQAAAKELAKQLASLERALPDLESRLARADQELAAWRAQLSERAAVLGLGPDPSPAAARQALVLVQDLAKNLDEIDALQKTRIETMQRDLASFAEEARALARELAPELVELEPEAISEALEARLASAQEAERNAQRMRDAIEKAESDLRAAEERIATEQARLRPLFEASGTSSLDALHAAIARADARRAVADRLAAEERSLGEAGDGLAIDALEAEVASEDRALLEERLASAERALELLEEQKRTRIVELDAAERALAAIRGQDAAAAAAAQRNEAISGMTDAVERYVRVRTAERLLRWAIERFRKEKQGPMLERASALFRTLTLGELERLVVEYGDDDHPTLAGIRRDGSRVPVDGMSTGTRDQLYLALRVAALELHLESATPLPFVADDLLVHYDDARAAAALRVLGELARRTQVLFFTHHEHLVEIARAELGRDLPVLRIDGLARGAA